MWETRHGFPVPHRLASGHRRYAESDVAAVEQVLRRRDAGIRLEVAISEAAASAPRHARPCSPSCAAGTRTWRRTGCESRPCSRSPGRSRTSAAPARSHPSLFGAFQERAVLQAVGRTVERARPGGPRRRWCSRTSPKVADAGTRRSPTRVPLAATPRCAASGRSSATRSDLPACLTAWELPGQSEVPDRHRIFEAFWTVDPRGPRCRSRRAQVAPTAGRRPKPAPCSTSSRDPAPR